MRKAALFAIACVLIIAGISGCSDSAISVSRCTEFTIDPSSAADASKYAAVIIRGTPNGVDSEQRVQVDVSDVIKGDKSALANKAILVDLTCMDQYDPYFQSKDLILLLNPVSNVGEARNRLFTPATPKFGVVKYSSSTYEDILRAME